MSGAGGSEARARTPVRRVLGWAVTTLVVVALALWAVTLRPLSFGGPAQYVVIHGNSMFPLYHDGDLIVSHAHSTYRTGDVVAYRVPKGQLGAGLVVIHRIIGGSPQTGFVMRGDNNPIADPWHPTAGDIVGSTWVRVPRLGKLFVALHQPIVPGLFFATVAVIVALTWRSTRGETAPAGPDAEELSTLEHLERVTTALQGRYARRAAPPEPLQVTVHHLEGITTALQRRYARVTA